VQPAHPGKPAGSPATVWSPAALAAAGVTADLIGEPDEVDAAGKPVTADAVLAAAVRAPSPLRTAGRWQLWELRFRARLGGGLLAVYDRQRDEHRWLWGTELDTTASHFEVLAFRDGLAVVRTTIEQDETVWLLDVARGVTRPLERRGPYHVVADRGLEVEAADGGRELLPWRALTP
jgi:hypothetical protein